MSRTRERYSFANLEDVLELPDLISIQRSSFEWFLKEGLANTFRDISPIKDFSETLQLELDLNVTALRESTNPITGLCCRLPVVLAKPAASKTTSGRQLTARPSERKRGDGVGAGEPGCSN